MSMLRDFKLFAGFSVEGIKSVGLLIITKAAGHANAAFSIPQGTIFRVGGQVFIAACRGVSLAFDK